MACAECPSGVVVSDAVIKSYAETSVAGVGQPTSQIAVKQGAPLSTSCDRASTIGAIPQVVYHPAFTMIGGGVAASLPSNAGFSPAKLAALFKKSSGCFSDIKTYGSTCCSE